jgi:predicted ATP-grasp superfamily ATP-dependent carboligase
VPIPETIVADSFEDVKNISLPCFVKANNEQFKIARPLYDIKELSYLIGLAQSHGDRLLVQELIPAPETYGFAFYAVKGKIKAYHIHKELFSIPPQGGNGVILSSIEDRRILDYSSRLIKHFQYTGIGLIEYKYHHLLDDYVLMELNPKFWASILFTHLSNPQILHQYIGNNDNESIPTIPGNSTFLFESRLFGLGCDPLRYLKARNYLHKCRENGSPVYRSSDFRHRKIEYYFSLYYLAYMAKRKLERR